MVASNPLFKGIWGLKRLRSTIINDIWVEVLFFGGVATMVYCISTFTPHNLSLDNQILDVLGIVLGLVISFRTSSAYDKYSEGRAQWSIIANHCRNIAQITWVNVPIKRKDMTELQAVIEKKTAVNMVQAFPVAVKHFLRSEPGVYYEDLYPLLSFLPRYASKNSKSHVAEDLLPLWSQSESEKYKIPHPGESSASLASMASHKSDGLGYLPTVDVHRPLRPARNPPKGGILSVLPFLRFFRWIGRVFFRRAQVVAETVGVKQRNALGRKRKTVAADSNVPVEVCLYLLSYLNYLIENDLIQLAAAGSVGDSISQLQATYSNLERIKNTPLPFAYQAHLRMSLWLYLFLVPFEIFDSDQFRWMVIPGTMFAAFLMLGFLEIGSEIEDPFGYDDNDLDVDQFVLSIQRELNSIVVHDSSDPFCNMFSEWNQPFCPADRRTASALLQHDAQYSHTYQGVEEGMDSVNRTLLNSWKEVEDKTRRGKFYN